MVSQFILMPAFAYFLGWAFLETNFERLGLLILGCSPGGANSNFWVNMICVNTDLVTLMFQTSMFHGDINLSCTMTFLSTVSSFAFTSLWVFLLGTPLVGKTITIPYLQIAMSLASFTVPLLLGVSVKVGL
jgi:predicted Na+-dependent transporter